jgi:hypothetical protein
MVANTHRMVLLVFIFSLGLRAAGLSVEKSEYTRGKKSVPSFIVENRYYKAVVAPEMGGRIVEWIDKSNDRNIVYDNHYGGLLDDHGSRIAKTYQAKWLKKSGSEAVLRLTLSEKNSKYVKKVHFYADRPVLKVDYHIENSSQIPLRLLFRNVVRPAGTEFSGQELYCYSRVVGLQHTTKGMPRTDDQADPWCALLYPPDKTVVANAFLGDNLERLYTWSGSKVAPTYEYMFNQLEAGKTVDFTYYWLLCHGLTSVDYACRDFVAAMDGAISADNELDVKLSIIATWAAIPKLRLTPTILDERGKAIKALQPVEIPVSSLDTVVVHKIKAALPPNLKYAVLTIKASAPGLLSDVVLEKPFTKSKKEKVFAGYKRPVRWIGGHVEQKPLPGWKKIVKYTIKPTGDDKKRGYLVFDESGENRGKALKTIDFDMMRNEPEGFPIHFNAISKNFDVTMKAKTPAGLSLKTFVPLLMPQKLWGRVMNGLKLIPGTEFKVAKGEDKTLFFRLKVDAKCHPGVYEIPLTFSPKGAEPTTVVLKVNVHPVRFPLQPYFSFDVNNCVNYLCSKKIRGIRRDWNEELAKNYLTDMEEHGIRSQTLQGINAPSSHYYYSYVRDVETGLPLTESIKKNRERFKNRLDMPRLDFTFWDWLIDRLLKHGQRKVKWPMGGCGKGFMQNHARLTKLIYGRTFPLGDIRQQAVKEWYIRELSRYLRDKGITRVLVTIDDEIPSEELAWWCQHAYRSIKMGLEPGVTQSAATIADDTRINMVAPFMKYWIIGTLNKKMMDKRRAQGIIKPEHWVTTYHSSANHWQPYDQMRGHCGLNCAYFGLDACWIQVYYRWRQSEAVIYPGKTGPIDSAAWEGARDGLDDANLYLLANSMIKALPDEKSKGIYGGKLAEIVGDKKNSIVRFADRVSGVGIVTSIENNPDTAVFRNVKRKLFALIAELKPLVPIQKANVVYARHPLIVNGVSAFSIPRGMRTAPKVEAFLAKVAGGLEFTAPKPEKVDPKSPYPILFCGTLAELRVFSPELAKNSALAGIDDKYPKQGSYAIRFARKPLKRGKTKKGAKKPRLEDQPLSMVVITTTPESEDKVFNLLANIVTQPKSQYTQWLLP